jgi:hypothetical protein
MSDIVTSIEPRAPMASMAASVSALRRIGSMPILGICTPSEKWMVEAETSTAAQV